MCRTVNYRRVFLHCSNVHGKAIAKRFLVVLFIWAYLTSCIVVLHSLNIPEPVFTVVNIQCADKEIPHGQGNKGQSTTHAFRSYVIENRLCFHYDD
jgi:hypothetical protein